MNTVTSSFDAVVRQMTEISQWPKCRRKQWLEYLSEKNVFLPSTPSSSAPRSPHYDPRAKSGPQRRFVSNEKM